MTKRFLPIIERLNLASIPIPECGCVVWLKRCNKGGYGVIRINRKLVLTHRAAFEEASGPIPYGKDVLHRCDVPSCINRHHLFLGTQIDNMKDMVSKHRQRSLQGENSPVSKLSTEQVKEIKALSAVIKDNWKNRPRNKNGTFYKNPALKNIADSYGITPNNIRSIIIGKTWRHI